jgi:heat shock protein beta
LVIVSLATLPTYQANAEDVVGDTPDINLKTVGSVTDDEVVQREQEAMSTDGYSVAEKKLLESGAQYQFQAEVSRLMSLIVNSLYSNRDVFLRELISNASDALDKIRFQSLSDPSLLDSNPNFEIRIQPDPENNQLHIIDTGIGMTKEDMINNLGTIAKSGTSEFIAKAETAADTSSLIGQFGVGFYSAFLVANRVTVTSKHNDDNQHIWSSDSEGVFVVGEDPEGNTLGRGTKITLHLKDDSHIYTDQDNLRALIARYSEFINFPIYMYASHIEKHEVAAEPEADDFDEAEEVEDDWEDFEIVEETVYEWELLNDVKPIWTRDQSEITEEEYIAFYKNGLSKSSDVEDPYSWVHFSAEGDLEFKAILYMPREVPDNMFDANRSHDNRGIRLYVRRVYITDEFDTIIPKYLSFIKGIVDSSSLPLNVSREILQQDKSLKLMQKKLVRKAIAMIQKLSIEDEEAYEDFYDDYRINLKLGVLEDRANQDRLAKLLRFHSSKSGNELVSLDQYIENMKEGQDKIYFLAGETRAALENSPLLEKLVSNDYEVLYFTDAIDEYWTQSYNAYESHKLINIAKDVDLDLEEPEEDNTLEEEEFQPLLDFFKSSLKSKVSKVVLSKRLTTTPSALISTAYSSPLTWKESKELKLFLKVLTHS